MIEAGKAVSDMDGKASIRDGLAAGLRAEGITVTTDAPLPMPRAGETFGARVFDELERSIPEARRDARGGLVLDGDAVMAAARRIDEQTGEVGYASGGDESGRATVTGVDPDARAAIPGGHRFLGRDGRQRDFTEGRDIQDIADALIERRECFGFLGDVLIRYRWRRKAQAKAGRMTLGYCQKLSGQLKDEMGGGEFQIVLNAENCRDLGLTNWQLEALVAHELMHIAPPDPDDPASEPSLVGHDAELFAAEIDQYGLWQLSLKKVAPAFVQASLAGI